MERKRSAEHRLEIARDDGFALVFSGIGWDIHAPVRDLPELPAEFVRLIERRLAADPGYDGLERRRGDWFAWAEDLEAAEGKIDREKRLRLFS